MILQWTEQDGSRLGQPVKNDKNICKIVWCGLAGRSTFLFPTVAWLPPVKLQTGVWEITNIAKYS